MSKHTVSFRIGRICRLFAAAGICLSLSACGSPAGAAPSGSSASSEAAPLSGTSAASAAETSAEALPVITVVTDTVEDGDGPAEETAAGKNTAEGNSAEPSAPDGTFTITFAGDILMDPGYSAGDALTKQGAEGSFDEEALSIMRDADLFVVNNEFAYTSRGTAVSKQYNFRADPKNAQILKDMGADLVTLGNNHTYDYGEEGLLDTLDTLDSAGVPYIGAGKNLEEASAPAIYTIDGFRISLVNAESILFNSGPPAQCAQEGKPGTFDCYRPEMLFEAVRKAKEQSDYCITVLHWGSEGKSTPNEKQLMLSRGAAEAGADLIIGGHPHVLQTIGRAGTVPVVYSLGNYLFHSGTYDTGVIQAVFRPSEKRLESLRFVPMQCRNMKVFTLSGSEKERLLKYMRSLSPEVQIDEDGIITLP